MDGDDLPRLIYLVLLLAVIAGYFIAESRGRWGKTTQQAAIWVLIFVGAIAVAGLWGDIRRTTDRHRVETFADRVEIPVAPDGHFYLTAEVNGTAVEFVVDTGASQIVLTRQDAARLGLDPDQLNYFGTAQTANGTVATAPVRLDSFVLGGFDDSALSAVVNAGALDTSLLGMSYLGRFELTFSRDRLVIRR